MTNEEINLFYRFLNSKGVQHNFDYFYRSYKFEKKSLDDYLKDIEAEYVIINAFDMSKCYNTVYGYSFWENLHHKWLVKLEELRTKGEADIPEFQVKCPHCGRMMPKSSFAVNKKGVLHKFCKECECGEWDKKRKEAELIERQLKDMEEKEKQITEMEINLQKTTKVCSHCGKRKLRSEFYSSNTSEDGLDSICKTCQKNLASISESVGGDDVNETKSKDGDFTFFDFDDKATVSRSIGRNQFAISNKKSSYKITMNVYDSQMLKEKGLLFLRIRRDNVTGAIHMIFNKDTGAKCVSNKCNVNVNNKNLVQFLVELLRLDKSKNRYIIDISENLSRIDGYATFLIKQK